MVERQRYKDIIIEQATEVVKLDPLPMKAGYGGASSPLVIHFCNLGLSMLQANRGCSHENVVDGLQGALLTLGKCLGPAVTQSRIGLIKTDAGSSLAGNAKFDKWKCVTRKAPPFTQMMLCR